MNHPTTGRWAATTNMTIALTTLYTAIDAPTDGPRMAILFGKSGYGKTVATASAAIRTNAAYLRIQALWTSKTLLEKLANELGIARIGNTSMKIFAQIEEHLSHEPRPLIFDEMDYAVERRIVNIIRDIADATGVPILMVGEESMPAKLKEWERFDNRIIATVQAMPCSLADGLLLRDLYSGAGQVEIADDLIEHFVSQCKGVTRRIITNINAAKRVAIDELSSFTIDRAAWGDRPVSNGDVPRIRRFEETR